HPYWHQMRSVAGNYLTALAEGARHACVVGEYAATDVVQGARVRHVRGQHPIHEFRIGSLFFGLVVAEHELPAAHGVRKTDGNVRTLRVCAQENIWGA